MASRCDTRPSWARSLVALFWSSARSVSSGDGGCPAGGCAIFFRSLAVSQVKIKDTGSPTKPASGRNGSLEVLSQLLRSNVSVIEPTRAQRVLWKVMEEIAAAHLFFWLTQKRKSHPRLEIEKQHVIRPKNHDEVLACSRRCHNLLRRRPLLPCARCLGILPHQLICWHVISLVPWTSNPQRQQQQGGTTVIGPLGQAGIVQSTFNVW